MTGVNDKSKASSQTSAGGFGDGFKEGTSTLVSRAACQKVQWRFYSPEGLTRWDFCKRSMKEDLDYAASAELVIRVRTSGYNRAAGAEARHRPAAYVMEQCVEYEGIGDAFVQQVAAGVNTGVHTGVNTGVNGCRPCRWCRAARSSGPRRCSTTSPRCSAARGRRAATGSATRVRASTAAPPRRQPFRGARRPTVSFARRSVAAEGGAADVPRSDARPVREGPVGLRADDAGHHPLVHARRARQRARPHRRRRRQGGATPASPALRSC